MRTDVQTIPGTSSYHHYIPMSETIISCKTISFQNNFKCIYDLLSKTSYNWCANDYVSVVFEDDWQIGIITNVIEEQLEAEISILI